MSSEGSKNGCPVNRLASEALEIKGSSEKEVHRLSLEMRTKMQWYDGGIEQQFSSGDNNTGKNGPV